MKNPKLSIIIASENASHTIEECLTALKRQIDSREIETIVVDCSIDGTQNIIKDKFPNVILLHFSERKSLPLLLGAGIARSTGDIAAITDAACIAAENWVSEILKAHESNYDVIGGSVECENMKSMVDRAAYFCEYGQFMHPLPEGVVNELPGNNVSFKRWTLKIGEEFVKNGFWKTYWCRKLQEEGIQLISVPSIIVRNKKSFKLKPLFIRRFLHGRCFAGMRIAKSFSLERLYYMAGAPILPLLFIWRIVKTIIPKKRYMKEFILSSPVLMLAIMCWSFGELYGYIAGPGNSCNKIYTS